MFKWHLLGHFLTVMQNDSLEWLHILSERDFVGCFCLTHLLKNQSIGLFRVHFESSSTFLLIYMLYICIHTLKNFFMELNSTVRIRYLVAAHIKLSTLTLRQYLFHWVWLRPVKEGNRGLTHLFFFFFFVIYTCSNFSKMCSYILIREFFLDCLLWFNLCW